jgi:hypothetical protein
VERALEECDVFLPLIGSRWLDSTDDQGQRRIDGPEDTVHFEIATAIRRAIPIIPILVDRAHLPNAKELPAAIASLTRYHGLEIDNDHYEDGIEKLVGALKARIEQPSKQQEDKKLRLASFVNVWTIFAAAFVVALLSNFIFGVTYERQDLVKVMDRLTAFLVPQAAVPTPSPSPKTAETRPEALRQMVDGAKDVDGYLLYGSARIPEWLNTLQFHQLRVINEAQVYASGLEERVRGLSNIRDQYSAYPEITKGLDAALPSLRELSSKMSAFSQELSSVDSSADAMKTIVADGNRLSAAIREAEAKLAPLRNMQLTGDGTESTKAPPK